MYQEKSSRRPPPGEEEEEGGEAGGEGRGGAVPARAECAATRWDLEEGMSQSGRVRGTSVYSCSLRQSLFFRRICTSWTPLAGRGKGWCGGRTVPR